MLILELKKTQDEQLMQSGFTRSTRAEDKRDVENQKRGSTLCRDDNYRPIILMEELPLGEFYDVEIIDSEYGFMTAILV